MKMVGIFSMMAAVLLLTPALNAQATLEQSRTQQEGDGKVQETQAADVEKRDEVVIWKQLRSLWRPESILVGGRELPESSLTSTKLTIGNKTYVVEMAGQKDEGDIALDLSGPLMAMDLNGKRGPNQGKLIPAIFKFEDNKLHICYNIGGEERPTEFGSPANSMIALIVYKRGNVNDQPDK